MTGIREEILKNLRIDLVGPGDIEEQIKDPPTIHYLTGILYPDQTPINPMEDDSRAETTGQSEELDDVNDFEQAPLAMAFMPSSIGLTVMVKKDTELVKCYVSYGVYDQIDPDSGWKRTPVAEVIDIPVGHDNSDSRNLARGGRLKWICRSGNEERFLTVFLFNGNRRPGEKEMLDRFCLFQPEIHLQGHGSQPVFVERSLENNSSDPDIETFSLLYRNKMEFGVGHGCAVGWSGVEGRLACRVFTEIIPTFELPKVEHLELRDLRCLDMMFLARCSDPEELISELEELPRAYENWITAKEKEVADLKDSQKPVAREHLARCRDVLGRIRGGIALLHNCRVRKAFQFANEAMLYQLSYGRWAAEYRRTGRRKTSAPDLNGRWRPFQLAFILLNLKGIVNPADDERELVDLLWFPTGGGKTEAYLGLAAFTIAWRRLTGAGLNGSGTAVLMRYTLRLLTIQQFQRAAALMCACEVLRRRDPGTWGTTPFSIGLWVGQSSTPNDVKDAEKALNDIRSGIKINSRNPVQLHACPWCGEKLTASNYRINHKINSLLIHCPREECEFHGNVNDVNRAIPVYTVDEDIYTRTPSIVIGTVDKMARVPWKPRAGAILGKVDRYSSIRGFLTPADRDPHKPGNGATITAVDGLAPPDLIIQDELHLISGPLGTMVGLYEAMVDELCTTEVDGRPVRPKVVASTATIRRAGDQIGRVFARAVRQFPPPGLTAEDNFFSFEKPAETTPGRLYAGVCARERSMKTTVVRVYASLLHSLWKMKQSGLYKPEELDPYWTLVGYFNSLRELGGAVRLVEDDIPDRISLLAGGEEYARPLTQVELTSRCKADEIPEILSALEKDATSDPIDVLLATNMISVGVDVDRLGLMVVNGQPKGTSEYIQATSRVGRRYPGLVVTLYNPHRPRDMSHYERFISYHTMLYRFVEATSVTPFSPRAVDRGLTGVVIGLARTLAPDLAPNNGAGQFDRFGKHRPLVDRIKQSLLTRVENVEPAERDRFELELERVFDWWERRRLEESDLRYLQPNMGRLAASVAPLIRHYDQNVEGARAIPESLREVEKECGLFYRRI
ncbi:DISARM system helicase DrmA [Desulfofundulus salinus]|uniref:DNA helicase n=1 Tax=Desulfofundulus salinus TaxID=2419843 RepID=A0A494X3Q4_9FIRM|nr:DISARM system helicase DrmA [Desulfofundulus salinum]RKO67805.1 DNA helicase [Desulfofundulus salinum]